MARMSQVGGASRRPALPLRDRFPHHRRQQPGKGRRRLRGGGRQAVAVVQ